MIYGATSVYVGGVDLSSLGFVCARVAGALAPAVERPPTAVAPGRFGERVTGAAATVPPRRITLTGTVLASSAAAYDTAVRDLLAACAGAASGPTSAAVTLTLAPAVGVAPAVQYTAYLTGATSAERDGIYLPGGPVTLVFECPDPIAVDVAETSVALSTSIVRCALGTVRSNPVLSLAGPFTARSVTLTDGAGATRGTLTITAPGSTVLTGHTVEVDTDAETVTHVHGGARDPHAAWLTAGDFFWLDPQHVAGGVNPGLALGAGTGSVTYRKAYR